MNTYQATARREGRWWLVTVPNFGVTQARRLSEVEQMVQEFIAVTLDQDPSTIGVTVDVDAAFDIDVSATVKEIHYLREEASSLERQAGEKARALAKALADADIPLRDIGEIIGVSHQRAHQLIQAKS